MTRFASNFSAAPRGDPIICNRNTYVRGVLLDMATPNVSRHSQILSFHTRFLPVIFHWQKTQCSCKNEQAIEFPFSTLKVLKGNTISVNIWRHVEPTRVSATEKHLNLSDCYQFQAKYHKIQVTMYIYSAILVQNLSFNSLQGRRSSPSLCPCYSVELTPSLHQLCLVDPASMQQVMCLLNGPTKISTSPIACIVLGE